MDDFNKFNALPDRVILELHNGYTRGLSVQRFSEREIMVEKTWKLIKDDVLNLSTATPEEVMAQEETAKAEGTTKAKGKKAAAPKKPARKVGEETPTVAKIVKLLQRKNGASKVELAEALPETKRGYIDALLTRIFKEKGYTLESEAVEGQRARRYKITAVPTAPAAE